MIIAMVIAALLIFTVLGAPQSSLPCQYGWHTCDDWRIPMLFLETTDNSTGTGEVQSEVVCVGDGSTWRLQGGFDSPAVQSFRCPDSTAPPPPPRRRAASSLSATALHPHVQHRKD